MIPQTPPSWLGRDLNPTMKAILLADMTRMHLRVLGASLRLSAFLLLFPRIAVMAAFSDGAVSFWPDALQNEPRQGARRRELSPRLSSPLQLRQAPAMNHLSLRRLSRQQQR